MSEEREGDFWRPEVSGPCWVCGRRSAWAYLDLGYQHRRCDAYPVPGGHIVIIGGVVHEGLNLAHPPVKK